jgi:hypothetical protein
MVDSERVMDFDNVSCRAFICSALGRVASHFAHGPPQAFKLARLQRWPIVAQSQIIINAILKKAQLHSCTSHCPTRFYITRYFSSPLARIRSSARIGTVGHVWEHFDDISPVLVSFWTCLLTTSMSDQLVEEATQVRNTWIEIIFY